MSRYANIKTMKATTYMAYFCFNRGEDLLEVAEFMSTLDDFRNMELEYMGEDEFEFLGRRYAQTHPETYKAVTNGHLDRDQIRIMDREWRHWAKSRSTAYSASRIEYTGDIANPWGRPSSPIEDEFDTHSVISDSYRVPKDNRSRQSRERYQPERKTFARRSPYVRAY